MDFRTVCIFSAAAFAAGLAVAALPQKLNLRERDKLVQELADKAKNAQKPLDRAVAQYDLLRLDTLLCEDKDLEAREKALEAFVKDPGVAGADYVAFLYNSVGVDYPLRRAELLKMAEKALASTNKADHAAYYASTFAKMAPGHWGWGDSDEPEFSSEARLALVERAEKDPLMAGDGRVLGWKVSALRESGRPNDAEKLMLDAMKAAEDKDKPAIAQALAEFYVDTAARFYSTPDPATLRKAVNMYEYKNSLSPNGDGRARGEIIKLLVSLGDLAGAKRWIEADTALQKDQVPTAASLLALGDIAFAEKNWAEAAKCYEKCPADKYDWRVVHKMAQAFGAAGSTNTLGYLELALKKCNNRYERPHLEFEISRLKK